MEVGLAAGREGMFIDPSAMGVAVLSTLALGSNLAENGDMVRPGDESAGETVANCANWGGGDVAEG